MCYLNRTYHVLLTSDYLQVDRATTIEHTLSQVIGISFSNPKAGFNRGKGGFSMKILRIVCMFGGFLSLVLSLSAQDFTTLHSFDGTDGASPRRGWSRPLLGTSTG